MKRSPFFVCARKIFCYRQILYKKIKKDENSRDIAIKKEKSLKQKTCKKERKVRRKYETSQHHFSLVPQSSMAGRAQGRPDIFKENERDGIRYHLTRLDSTCKYVLALARGKWWSWVAFEEILQYFCCKSVAILYTLCGSFVALFLLFQRVRSDFAVLYRFCGILIVNLQRFCRRFVIVLQRFCDRFILILIVSQHCVAGFIEFLNK